MGGRATPYRGPYGPARLLNLQDVASMAGQLAALDLQTVRSWYDPATFERMNIPPGEWEDPGAVDWLMSYLERLVSFYREAARSGDAILVYLT